MPDLHDLLRTPPFFGENERMRELYDPPRRKRNREQVKTEKKSKEKGDGFLRKLMAGWQGFGRGGVPGAFFSVADYDKNKQARQNQAMMDMEAAIADIENVRAQGHQRRGAGESSYATANATERGANRADQMHPGALGMQGLENMGQGLENAGQRTDNAMEEFKRLNQQERFDADISQTKNQARQMGSLADQTQKTIGEMGQRLGMAKTDVGSRRMSSNAASRRAATGEEGQAIKGQLTAAQRKVNEYRLQAQQAMISGDQETSTEANRLADELQAQINKARPRSFMDQLMENQMMMEGGGFLAQ